MEPDSTGGMQFHSGKGMFCGGPAQIPEELQEDRRLSLPIIRIGIYDDECLFMMIQDDYIWIEPSLVGMWRSWNMDLTRFNYLTIIKDGISRNL